MTLSGQGTGVGSFKVSPATSNEQPQDWARAGYGPNESSRPSLTMTPTAASKFVSAVGLGPSAHVEDEIKEPVHFGA